MKIKKILINIILVFLLNINAYALEHFTDFIKNYQSTCVYAGKILIEGLKIQNNEDEVGVFVNNGTDNELLVGGAVIGEILPDSYIIQIYRDVKEELNENQVKDGAYNGEELIFKVWDKSENIEYIIPPDCMWYEEESMLTMPDIPPVWKESPPTYGLLNLSLTAPVDTNKKLGLQDVIIMLKYLSMGN